MKAMLMHFLVASVWTFLQGNATLGGFITGGIASFFLLWIFQKVLGCEDYIRRALATLSFAGHFLYDVARSNLAMAKLCLQPGVGKRSGSFTTYDVGDLTPTETVLLAYFINLTPGTTVADRTEQGCFVLHSFPAVESTTLEERINKTLRKPLLEITR